MDFLIKHRHKVRVGSVCVQIALLNLAGKAVLDIATDDYLNCSIGLDAINQRGYLFAKVLPDFLTFQHLQKSFKEASIKDILLGGNNYLVCLTVIGPIKMGISQ